MPKIQKNIFFETLLSEKSILNKEFTVYDKKKKLLKFEISISMGPYGRNGAEASTFTLRGVEYEEKEEYDIQFNSKGKLDCVLKFLANTLVISKKHSFIGESDLITLFSEDLQEDITYIYIKNYQTIQNSADLLNRRFLFNLNTVKNKKVLTLKVFNNKKNKLMLHKKEFSLKDPNIDKILHFILKKSNLSNLSISSSAKSFDYGFSFADSSFFINPGNDDIEIMYNNKEIILFEQETGYRFTNSFKIKDIVNIDIVERYLNGETYEYYLTILFKKFSFVLKCVGEKRDLFSLLETKAEILISSY